MNRTVIRYGKKHILAFTLFEASVLYLTVKILNMYSITDLLTVLTLFTLISIPHELLHMYAAKIFGKDCRLVVKYFGFGIVLNSPVTYSQLVAICSAPQAITLALLLLYVSTGCRIVLATALVHAAASVGDMYNILRIGVERMRIGKNLIVVDREDGFEILRLG